MILPLSCLLIRLVKPPPRSGAVRSALRFVIHWGCWLEHCAGLSHPLRSDFCNSWTVACHASVHGIFQVRILTGCHSLLQGIFPTTGSNPCLLRLPALPVDSLLAQPLGKLEHCYGPKRTTMPHNSYVQVLTPTTLEHDCIQSKGLQRGIC